MLMRKTVVIIPLRYTIRVIHTHPYICDKKKACPEKSWPLLTYEKHQFQI